MTKVLIKKIIKTKMLAWQNLDEQHFQKVGLTKRFEILNIVLDPTNDMFEHSL